MKFVGVLVCIQPLQPQNSMRHHSEKKSVLSASAHSVMLPIKTKPRLPMALLQVHTSPKSLRKTGSFSTAGKKAESAHAANQNLRVIPSPHAPPHGAQLVRKKSDQAEFSGKVIPFALLQYVHGTSEDGGVNSTHDYLQDALSNEPNQDGFSSKFYCS